MDEMNNMMDEATMDNMDMDPEVDSDESGLPIQLVIAGIGGIIAGTGYIIKKIFFRKKYAEVDRSEHVTRLYKTKK